MVEEFIGLFKGILNFVTLEQKDKYLDKLLSLEKDWYEEYNKPVGVRDDANLDNIKYELRVLGRAFTSAIGATVTQA